MVILSLWKANTIFLTVRTHFPNWTFRNFIPLRSLSIFISWLPKKPWLDPRQKEDREQREGLKTGQIGKLTEQVCWVNICFTPVLLMLTGNSNTASLQGSQCMFCSCSQRVGSQGARMAPRAATSSARLQILLSQIMRKEMMRDFRRYFLPTNSPSPLLQTEKQGSFFLNVLYSGSWNLQVEGIVLLLLLV